MSDRAEKACSYAALILADDSVEITPDRLLALLQAAGIDDMEPIWTTLFAKALEGRDVEQILTEIPETTDPSLGRRQVTTHPDSKDDDDKESSDGGGGGNSIEDGEDDSDGEEGFVTLFD
ncbi:hypothetical protein K504DRAFT_459412 [Pleomassaria siparia CBS 279.74]|uniref:Large ribosomal subunit protein P1 n=1 Tax=Pleomassaria siparia CBS 279.74 TaxID=1314801 RepID=A0A6G1K2Y4_9PLEO|nr:hypothetical protein K504DRAFT_459412 [Pleomassaria siparia CBS 279.74]